VTEKTTFDPALGLRWSVEVAGEGNPAAFFLAPERFESASRTEDSYSLTLTGDQIFGLGVGPNPPLNQRWTRCVIDHSSLGESVGPLRAGDHWDFYSVKASATPVDGDVVVLHDIAEITELLQIHAADSSVWPSDPEVVDWYGLRDENDYLVSLGALVRWESGMHVLASIVTVTELRGQGFAQELTQGIIARAREQGIEWLGLGVSHANVAAQRVYRKAGFVLRANFTTYTSDMNHDD
jgi:ribosomal protein S18 acetylase RimI-like enzyme